MNNAIARYDAAIERLTSRIHDHRKRNPRPVFQARSEINRMQAERETLVSNRYKLRAAYDAVNVYSEQVDTHGKESYTGALVIAKRAVAYYERLAPAADELVQVE